jgi:hypothetical protein
VLGRELLILQESANLFLDLRIVNFNLRFAVK